jgi:hypothetical protein
VPESDLEGLLERLIDARFDFVVVGGFAAIFHGSEQVSQDVDVRASFTEENLSLLLRALDGTRPRLRGRPGLPLPGGKELSSFKNLFLETDWGDLDVHGEIAGVGAFETVRARSIEAAAWGRIFRVLDLDALIEGKRALGRDKDLRMLRTKPGVVGEPST